MRWIILMRVSSPLYYLLRSAPMASFYVFMAGVYVQPRKPRYLPRRYKDPGLRGWCTRAGYIHVSCSKIVTVFPLFSPRGGAYFVLELGLITTGEETRGNKHMKMKPVGQEPRVHVMNRTDYYFIRNNMPNILAHMCIFFILHANNPIVV